MNRKRLLIATAIVLGYLVWLFLLSPGALQWRELNESGFEKVEFGMSLDQVEELLGGPPGNYGKYAGLKTMTLELVRSPPGSMELWWSDDDTRFEIFFDPDNDTVVVKHERAAYEQARTLWSRALGRLLRLLGI